MTPRSVSAWRAVLLLYFGTVVIASPSLVSKRAVSKQDGVHERDTQALMTIVTTEDYLAGAEVSGRVTRWHGCAADGPFLACAGPATVGSSCWNQTTSSGID